LRVAQLANSSTTYVEIRGSLAYPKESATGFYPASMYPVYINFANKIFLQELILIIVIIKIIFKIQFGLLNQALPCYCFIPVFEETLVDISVFVFRVAVTHTTSFFFTQPHGT
jgi:hypothetical protein